MRGTETITVIRAARVDRLRGTGAAPTEHDIDNCIVWPRTSDEEGQGTVVISGENVFTPPGADIKAADRVRLRGSEYEVIGEPGDYRLRGRQKGLLAVLKKVS